MRGIESFNFPEIAAKLEGVQKKFIIFGKCISQWRRQNKVHLNSRSEDLLCYRECLDLSRNYIFSVLTLGQLGLILVCIFDIQRAARDAVNHSSSSSYIQWEPWSPLWQGVFLRQVPTWGEYLTMSYCIPSSLYGLVLIKHGECTCWVVAEVFACVLCKCLEAETACQSKIVLLLEALGSRSFANVAPSTLGKC